MKKLWLLIVALLLSTAVVYGCEGKLHVEQKPATPDALGSEKVLYNSWARKIVKIVDEDNGNVIYLYTGPGEGEGGIAVVPAKAETPKP